MTWPMRDILSHSEGFDHADEYVRRGGLRVCSPPVAVAFSHAHPPSTMTSSCWQITSVFIKVYWERNSTDECLFGGRQIRHRNVGLWPACCLSIRCEGAIPFEINSQFRWSGVSRPPRCRDDRILFRDASGTRSRSRCPSFLMNTSNQMLVMVDAQTHEPCSNDGSVSRE
jgi:hypothetical protein